MREDTTGGLVEEARRGEPRAVQRLLEPHLRGLEAFVSRNLDPVLRKREAVDDIVQSACREVIMDLSRFDPGDRGEQAFRGWLYRTALRKLQDRRRYHQRHKRDPAREAQISAGSLVSLHGSKPSPSQEAIGQEQRQELHEAMARLSDAYRTVIEMAYFEQLTAAEIAARLGRTKVAVHSLLARALARLTGYLGNEQSEAHAG